MKNKTIDFHPIAWLRNRILAGMIIVLPIGLTFWLGYFLFTALSSWAVNFIEGQYPSFILKESGNYRVWALWTVRCASIFFLLTVLCCIGQLGRYTLGKKLLRLTDTAMRQLPMLNTIYSTAMQIWDAIWSSREQMTSKVVMFEYPRKGIWVVGFLTNDNPDPAWEPQRKTGQDLVSIFLPTTPNPTSGFFLMVPREDCIFLDMDTTETMQMIISGGAVISKNKKILARSNSQGGSHES